MRHRARLARPGLLAPILVAAVPVCPACGQAIAPSSNDELSDDGRTGNDIIVTGLLATRTSLEVKRNALLIGDGLVAGEIDATPGNSIGNALERIPGLTADRFKGNASEVSVRGLGPTLSLSTFNGREMSTAGPDRSVSFQQFPSDLVSRVFVYKSQQADFLEGGVGGIIDLEAPRPLDDRGRRIQGELRGDFKPKDDDVYQHDGLGYRVGLSYSDQFETGIGEIGISIGVRAAGRSAPEDYYSTSAVFQPCNTRAAAPEVITGTAAQISAAGSGVNCAFASAPRTGIGETIGDTYYLAAGRTFRAQKTREARDAVVGMVQWRPTGAFEMIADGQYSFRRSLEDRNILNFADGLRGIQPLVVGTGANGYSQGALISFRGNSFLEDQLETRNRNEEYLSGGLAWLWRPGRFSLKGDLSYSGSHRIETQKATRMRSSRRVAYTQTYRDGDVVPQVAFDGADIADPALFAATAADAVYARRRFATDRHDRIWAGRVDAAYAPGGVLREIKVGARYSDHRRRNDNAANADLNALQPVGGQTSAQLIMSANANCRAPFTTSSFMAGLGGNVTRWATFDNDCLFRTFTGSDDALPYPTETRDPSDIDVRERTVALYVMATFQAQLGGTVARGNAGLRYVNTRTSSTGYRLPYILTVGSGSNDYNIAPNPAGTVASNRIEGGYRYWLPSANLSFALSPIVTLRLAGYRAIARSSIESLGAGIAISPSAGSGTANILFNATTGNPRLKPLRSWNVEASADFYLNQDTLLSFAGYYKWVRGAVIGATTPVPVTISIPRSIDGGPAVPTDITIFPLGPTNDGELRHLYGVELIATHAFTWLPSPLDGFGATASLNRALSNFEFPDVSPLAAFLEPADLIGLSKLTASGSIYWEKAGFALRALYRYRSTYYKPNSATNRSVRGSGYLDLSSSYDLNRHIQVKAQALNVTGTSDVFFKGGYDSITEVSSTGPQYFLGMSMRF